MSSYAFQFIEFEYSHHELSGHIRPERMILCRAGSVSKVHFTTQGGIHSGWHGDWSYIMTPDSKKRLVVHFNWRGASGKNTCMSFSACDGQMEGEFEVIADDTYMFWNKKHELISIRVRSSKSVAFNFLKQLTCDFHASAIF